MFIGRQGYFHFWGFSWIIKYIEQDSKLLIECATVIWGVIFLGLQVTKLHPTLATYILTTQNPKYETNTSEINSLRYQRGTWSNRKTFWKKLWTKSVQHSISYVLKFELYFETFLIFQNAFQNERRSALVIYPIGSILSEVSK